MNTRKTVALALFSLFACFMSQVAICDEAVLRKRDPSIEDSLYMIRLACGSLILHDLHVLHGFFSASPPLHG